MELDIFAPEYFNELSGLVLAINQNPIEWRAREIINGVKALKLSGNLAWENRSEQREDI